MLMASYTTPAQYILRKVSNFSSQCWCNYDITMLGDLTAIHRKVHLFDVDIPGKITFKVNKSSAFEERTEAMLPSSGKRGIDRREYFKLL